MEVSTAKAISMLTLGLGSFITGMLPACVSETTRQRHPLFISCLLCFGAGVLLSTSLTHMLPEAREKTTLSELMLCIGFFVVYFVDELVHLFYGTSNGHHYARNYGSSEETGLLGSNRDLGSPDGEMRDRCCGETENPRMCHVSHTAPCNKSSSGVIGLLCALFVHSFLEGLAIGLQENAAQVSVSYFVDCTNNIKKYK